MIKKIGVIYQDRNSIGFLQGLRERLNCNAELIEPPAAIGKVKVLPRRQAKAAWQYFRKQGVDLVVRFTDADGGCWQDIQRRELDVVPDEAKSLWICAVAVNNPEEWLALDVEYLAGATQLSSGEISNVKNRTGNIKRALGKLARAGDGLTNVVAQIVRDAPAEVFQRWLEDESLRGFYSECRAAATREECPTPNELDTAA